MKNKSVSFIFITLCAIAILPVPTQALALVREPYLQMVTPSSMVVRWRTDAAVIGVLRYGMLLNSRTLQSSETTARTEHLVRITGLTASTRYYYSVETQAGIMAGGDSSYYFITQPEPGTAQATRIWVISDPGQGSSTPRNAAINAYYEFNNNNAHSDLIISDGDQAEDGLDAEYTSDFLAPLKAALRNTPIYTAMGNHERITSKTDTLKPYFQMVTLPTQGEMGGAPSGTEAYYSFDYGNIHFICLNSEISDDSEGGPQQAWLKRDLAATPATQLWRIAYVHRPFHSIGHHNMETSSYTRYRTTFLSILEQYGVDLIIQGHNHIYERTYLLDSLYGTYLDIKPSNKIDPGPGPYRKGTGAHQGEIFMTVTGTGYAYASLENGAPSPLCIKAIAGDLEGTVALDINKNVLHSTFIDRTGAIQDTFSITKGASTAIRSNKQNKQPALFSAIPSSQGFRFQITLEAPGAYQLNVYAANGKRVWHRNGVANPQASQYWGKNRQAGKGIYFARLTHDKGSITQKILVLD